LRRRLKGTRDRESDMISPPGLSLRRGVVSALPPHVPRASNAINPTPGLVTHSHQSGESVFVQRAGPGNFVEVAWQDMAFARGATRHEATKAAPVGAA
jgi:hypothetical protein